MRLSIVNFLHDLSLTIQKFGINHECLSMGHLDSKKWMVDMMLSIQEYRRVGYGTVFYLCGWYGVSAALMLMGGVHVDKIRSFDIDPTCWRIAESINQTSEGADWRFKAVTEDIFNINFEANTHYLWSSTLKRTVRMTESPDTIINTSCEHTDSSWFMRVPTNKVLVLQSTDYKEGEGHINCMANIEHFKEEYPMRSIFYAGEREQRIYKRFMIIGVK